jgi:hypothetical protein
MTRLVYSFVREPRGAEYRALIRAIATLSAEVMLVVQDNLGLEVQGGQVLQDLQGSLIGETRSSSWPGTTLIGHEASVFRFRVDENVVAVLTRVAEGLYDWRQPTRPEDPCFLRSDGTAILSTIAHERDAVLEIDGPEYELAVAACSWLPRALARDWS